MPQPEGRNHWYRWFDIVQSHIAPDSLSFLIQAPVDTADDDRLDFTPRIDDTHLMMVSYDAGIAGEMMSIREFVYEGEIGAGPNDQWRVHIERRGIESTHALHYLDAANTHRVHVGPAHIFDASDYRGAERTRWQRAEVLTQTPLDVGQAIIIPRGERWARTASDDRTWAPSIPA